MKKKRRDLNKKRNILLERKMLVDQERIQDLLSMLTAGLRKIEELRKEYSPTKDPLIVKSIVTKERSIKVDRHEYLYIFSSFLYKSEHNLISSINSCMSDQVPLSKEDKLNLREGEILLS